MFVNTPADPAAEESMHLLASWWATEREHHQPTVPVVHTSSSPAPHRPYA
jgi:hypothetical protein